MNLNPPRGDAGLLAEHLRRHARRYYPQIADQPLHVRYLGATPCRFAVLHDFELRTSDWRRGVLAKVTRDEGCSSDEPPLSGLRARFVSSPDRRGAESAALSDFQQAVDLRADPRLFAVPVLDSILDDRALLMERVAAMPLTRLLRSASRVGQSRPSPELLRTIENAGAAISVLHQMPAGGMRSIRGASRDEFLDWVEAAEEFFVADPAAYRFYRAAARRLRDIALEVLSDKLVSGPLHNDFAPRNVLVDGSGRVALIDMLDEWTGCVWEDVAHFLVSLEANKAQAWTGGTYFRRTTLAAMRAAVLSGYTQGKPYDERVIRLYEAQVALTKWAVILDKKRHSRGLLRPVYGWLGGVTSRWLARYASFCLKEAEAECDSVRVPTSELLAGGSS